MSAEYNLSDSLGYRLTLLSRINERRFETMLTPLGLTRVTWCVLLAIGQEGLQSPSEIAEWIGIDRTATSRALRGLERHKLIERRSGTQDKRTKIVDISKAGAAALADANQAARQNSGHFKSKLTWYEQDMLSTIIQKLIQDEIRDIPSL